MEKEIEWLLKEKYSGKASKSFYKDVEKLKKGEPLDYVIGFTEFLGCNINLSKKPLIPRSETEFWVQKTINELRINNDELKALDMFAGSGCIGVSIMRHIKNANLVFAEKEKKLIGQIKINCKMNNINAQKYKIIQSDIFKNVKGIFDVIFANPPYIPLTKKKKIQPSVLNYEPHQALFGGSDGLLYIKKFLAQAKNFLSPNGKIYMEFDPHQKSAIEKLLKKYRYKHWQFHQDQYHKNRYVIIKNKI